MKLALMRIAPACAIYAFKCNCSKSKSSVPRDHISNAPSRARRSFSESGQDSCISTAMPSWPQTECSRMSLQLGVRDESPIIVPRLPRRMVDDNGDNLERSTLELALDP